MQLFDKDGNPISLSDYLSQEDVDLAEVLPSEVIAKHPDYQEQRTLFEQEREARIAARIKFRKQLEGSQDFSENEAEALETPSEDENPTPPNNPSEDPVTPPAPIDTDALYREFRERLAREQAEEAAAQAEYANTLTAIMNEYNLPESYRGVLDGYNDPTKARNAAQTIAKDRRFDDFPPGGEDEQRSSIFDEVDKQLGFKGLT